ncbi:577_t:CDS:2, partial [Paraglomus brasilianum]
SHLLSISLSTSTLKRAKDKAYKLNNAAERSFQRIEVTSFFKRLDAQIDTNTTKSLANATENLANAKEFYMNRN